MRLHEPHAVSRAGCIEGECWVRLGAQGEGTVGGIFNSKEGGGVQTQLYIFTL